jgi:uncharacterized membrane protein
MRNYVTIVFDNASKAYDGQHALWLLDAEQSITVHGTAVVHRDDTGQFGVDMDDTAPPGLATFFGAGLGALVGALAGPAGAAAGAAGGAAIGAGVGGTAGLIAEVSHSDVDTQAGYESQFQLKPGQYAVVADVSENWTTPIDTQMGRIGGKVFRRARKDIRQDSLLSPNAWDSYLYPYEYKPNVYA